MIKESGIVERIPSNPADLLMLCMADPVEAATLIAELQAERDRDRLHWNGRAVELQVNGHGWMKAHDQLLGWVQSHPEMLRAMTDEKFAVKYPSPADVPEILQRALAAESSLHRVRVETIEAAVKIIAQAKAREVEIFDAANRDAALSDTGRRGIQDRALGRDSLARDLITSISSLNITGLDTGAVKTAESCHSPSTLNAETE